MKKTFIFFIISLLFHGNIISQKRNVLISIDDYQVSKAEFERIYKKNNQVFDDKSQTMTPEEYLEMYINFKLKVIEAQKLGMDTVSAFRAELEGYRRELAAPYLTDMKYDESLIRELYERSKKEINASHILFRTNPENDSGQEQSVLQKAEKVRQEILNGKDFNQAAFEYSEDPSAKSNKGNLGYFSAFQMVTPFENEAFKLSAGQVSEPVKTAFGYHLIKVHDIRDNQGEIKVAHIMKMFPQGGEFDKTILKNEIDSVYRKLINGASFEEMAKLHSDDKRSAAENGEMPWFSSNRMIPEFSEPAFKLKNKGDISHPVETPFGYHIIKKIDQRPVPSFEEMKATIEDRIKKDPERSSSTRKIFIDKLKKEYSFKELENDIHTIGHLPAGSENENNPLLFFFDKKNFYFEDFRRYLLNENKKEGTYADYYQSWTEFEIIKIEDSRLEEKYPDFNYLMKEYHDGLLFFNIMEEKIWKFSADDSIGLNQYYSENPAKFLWEERFKGMIVSCKNKDSRIEAEKYLEAQLPPAEVDYLINKEEKLIELKEGQWEKGDNPVIDYYVWSSQMPSGFNPDLTFIMGDIIDPEPKTLDEAKGLYISAYQDYIEKEWIKSLHRNYKIKVNKKLLKTIPHA